MITTAFYPMRPMTGPKLTIDNVLLITSDYLHRGYILQRKLNGDRVVMIVKDFGATFWNRYTGIYSFAVNNEWGKLPVGTVMDGEVYQGEYYPFELIQLGKEKILTTQERVVGAENICRTHNQEYVYGGVTNDWLVGEVMMKHERTSMWEGVVAKLKSARYEPLNTATQESPAWSRLKWV